MYIEVNSKSSVSMAVTKNRLLYQTLRQRLARTRKGQHVVLSLVRHYGAYRTKSNEAVVIHVDAT